MGQNNSFDDSYPPPPPPPSAGKTDMKFIALLVICVVLIAGLISVFVVYQPTNLQAQITEKNNEISKLNNEISTLQTQIANLTSQLSSVPNVQTYENQIASLNAEITNYTGQLNSAQSVLTMQSTETLIDAETFVVANSTNVYDKTLPYPGYIVIQETSSSNTTWAQTTYSDVGVNFNQNVTLGTSGSIAFPVLPTAVEVNIGQTGNVSGNATVTLTYYY
jgi:cell division protein FtsL